MKNAAFYCWTFSLAWLITAFILSALGTKVPDGYWNPAFILALLSIGASLMGRKE
jgi:hypothetical protein